MSLPARDRRRLTVIQGALGHSDPGLASLFAIFSRLTQEEEMPHVERLRVRVDRVTAHCRCLRMAMLRRLRIIVITPVALAATAGALLIGGWSSSPGACRIAPVAAHLSHSRTPSRSWLTLCQSSAWRPVMVGR